MAVVYYNLVKAYSLSTGTGNLTLGDAVPGFQSWEDAAIPDGTQVRYQITLGIQKEIGLGTFSGGILTRSTVEFSTSDGAKIDVGLNAQVSIVFSAADLNTLAAAAETVEESAAEAAASAAAAAASEAAAEAAQAAAEAAAASVPSIDTDGTLAANSDLVVPSQKAVKTYVDGIAVNLGKRQRVRVATTANIAIATALNNGDALDGVTLATGDLVLVKDQSAGAENGIYTVGAVPARAAEFNTYNEHPGSLISVAEGTANADTLWLCTSNEGGTLDTTAIVFSQVRFSAASETVSGIIEIATAAETTTGTDAARAVSPDGLAGSNYGKFVASILVFDDSQNVAAGDGAGDVFWRVPAILSGFNLVAVAAQVQTAGTTNTTDIQVRNVTQAADMLTTKITIDSTEKDSSTAAAAAVIDAANDDVATGDEIRIDVDAVSTTPPKGLVVELTFQLP